MRLSIISDCVHVLDAEGNAASDVHIFVRQMEALAIHFSEVHICCPFIKHNGTTAVTAYTNKKISFIPLRNVGGDGITDKLKLFAQIPAWFSAFRKANKLSDIVYQRFPNNLNIPGFFYFYFIGKKTFATYTGTWEKNNTEPFTYSFQKWLLRKLFNGPVGVYNNASDPQPHIFKSFSPSYSLGEWDEETENVASKVERINKEGLPLLSMITVGSFISYKNQQYILDTCLLLKQDSIPFHLYMVGDGELMFQYRKFIEQNSLQDCITLTGKLSYVDVRALYRKTNFVVQAPLMEGFGKVPIEGYFHGTVPVINHISMANYLTKNGTLGYLFSAQEKESLYSVLKNIYQHPQGLQERIVEARIFVQKFTLENWASEYFEQVKFFYPELITKSKA